jgi:hypothetical protein
MEEKISLSSSRVEEKQCEVKHDEGSCKEYAILMSKVSES